jgi:hypothetical protein
VTQGCILFSFGSHPLILGQLRRNSPGFEAGVRTDVNDPMFVGIPGQGAHSKLNKEPHKPFADFY